jgi:hypothetical protein
MYIRIHTVGLTGHLEGRVPWQLIRAYRVYPALPGRIPEFSVCFRRPALQARVIMSTAQRPTRPGQVCPRS